MRGYRQSKQGEWKIVFANLSPCLLYSLVFLDTEPYSSSWYTEGDTLTKKHFPYKSN